jgi:hypothetical protein
MSNNTVPAASLFNAATEASLEQMLALALVVPVKGDPTDPASVLWGLSVMLHGEPGIGKSSRIGATSKALGLPCETVLCSIHPPEAFSGVPVQTPEGLRMMPVLAAARDLAGKRGVLFLDEATTAPRATQFAAMGVTLDRVVGELKLGGGVRVVMAGNAASDIGGFELNAALANRLCHLDAPKPTADEWGDYQLGATPELPDLSAAEERVAERWNDCWAVARASVAAFVRRRPELLHKMPAEGPDRGRAFPTPRSMEQAARVYATALCLQAPASVWEPLVVGCIGSGAANELFAALVDLNLPDPKDVIEGNAEGCFPKRVDRTRAVVEAVASVVISAKKPASLQLAVGAWTFYGKVLAAGMADLLPAPVAALNKGGLAFGKQIDPVSNPVLQALHRSGVQKV